MLKIHFLQQWYDLSDPGMEEAIYDRNSFQKFLEIDLLGDTVPDETTILNFRHLLEKHDLQEQFLVIVNDLLAQRGLTVKHGTITDATIVAAPPSTKNKEKKRDPEMHQTKKGNQWHFGMKAHVGTDTKGFVHTVEVTKASIHDGAVQERLYHGEEKAKFGDSAYQSKAKKQAARKAKIYWGVADKAARNHPLSPSQKKRNHQTSGVRSFVEHPFQVIKSSGIIEKSAIADCERTVSNSRVSSPCAICTEPERRCLSQHDRGSSCLNAKKPQRKAKNPAHNHRLNRKKISNRINGEPESYSSDAP